MRYSELERLRAPVSRIRSVHLPLRGRVFSRAVGFAVDVRATVALSEAVAKPLAWWQLPIGNMALTNAQNAWHDNRVDYLLTHTGEVVAAHGVLLAFGAGDGAQTTPETDGGNLISKVTAYAQATAQISCP